MPNTLTFLLGLLLAGFLGACNTAATDNDHADHDHTEAPLPETVSIPAITFDALYVVNGGDSSISVINTETNQVERIIHLKNIAYPHHLSLTADRGKLLVAVPGQDLSGGHSHGSHSGGSASYILMIDATTGTLREVRKLDHPAHNAVMDPAGNGIWAAQTATPGTVLMLDPVFLGTRNTVSVGAMPLEVSLTPNGQYVFVANSGSDNVTVIDAATKAVVKTIAVGDGPVGAWPGSNGVMYVDNETGKSLTAINATTLENIRTYNLGFTPAMAAVAPDGTLWVTDTDNGKVAIYRTEGQEKIAEITVGSGAHAIAFNGNGTTGYVSNQNAGTVSVIDVAGRTVVKNITVGAKPNGIVWRKQ